MKFLTVPRLQKVSAMMQAVDVGDRIIHARVEAYSCQPTRHTPDQPAAVTTAGAHACGTEIHLLK